MWDHKKVDTSKEGKKMFSSWGKKKDQKAEMTMSNLGWEGQSCPLKERLHRGKTTPSHQGRERDGSITDE